MRRTFVALPVLALLSSGLVGLVPVVPAAASDVTTVWHQVTATCTSNETQVGQACFDGAGHGGEYDSISDTAAQGKNNIGEVNNYTYDVPDTIAVGQPSHVVLTAMVSQITDGGAHSRLCVSGSFEHGGTDEPCATTSEAANGQSASASHTVALLPSQASSGEVATLTIGFEEPGGHLDYAYVADNVKTEVNFAFSLDRKIATKHGTAHVTLTSSGHFDVFGPLGPNMRSESEVGTAVLRVKRGDGATHSAHLKLTRASFDDPYAATLHFRVVKSTLKRVSVGQKHQIDARSHTFIETDDLYYLDGRVEVGQYGLKVRVTS